MSRLTHWVASDPWAEAWGGSSGLGQHLTLSLRKAPAYITPTAPGGGAGCR